MTHADSATALGMSRDGSVALLPPLPPTATGMRIDLDGRASALDQGNWVLVHPEDDRDRLHWGRVVGAFLIDGRAQAEVRDDHGQIRTLFYDQPDRTPIFVLKT